MQIINVTIEYNCNDIGNANSTNLRITTEDYQFEQGTQQSSALNELIIPLHSGPMEALSNYPDNMEFPLVIDPTQEVLTYTELQERIISVVFECLGISSIDDITDPFLYNEIINLMNGIIETGVSNESGAADLFGMRLYYIEENNQLSAPAQFNGNISWIEWSVPHQDVHQYGFAYDANDRLTQAIYRGIGKTQCDERNPGAYDVHINGYDALGNIQGITRNGLVQINQNGPLYGVVDNLSFSYTANKLMAANESSVQNMGYSGGATETFTYDATGNLTSQSNKSLSSVEYFYQDLPKKFTFPSGSITNYYTANGQKLKSVVDSMGVITEKFYEDGFEYEDGSLVSIYHEEGRIVFSGGNLETEKGTKEQYAEWIIRDHLGNTRVRFADKDGDDEIEVDRDDYVKSELLGSYHYYPFGMVMDGDWDPGQSAEYEYQYNGKETVGSFNLDYLDFNSRWYDPTIGRFTSVDPLASERSWVSPYNYVQNNPINRIDPTGALDEWYLPEGGSELVYDERVNSQDDLDRLGIAGTYMFESGARVDDNGNTLSYNKDGTVTDAIPLSGVTVSAENPNKQQYLSGGALAIAGTTSAVDGPLPFGEAVGLGILATAATVDLTIKMQREIDRIAQKVNNTPGFQYALVATHSGSYPNVRGGMMQLNAVDVWKYGETTQLNGGRYSQTWLTNSGLRMQPQFFGNVVQIKIEEKRKLYGYFFSNGTLPPGNRIFR